MLDIKQIRQDAQNIENKLKNKDPSVDLTSLLQLDEKMRVLLTEVEKLKAQRNQLSKEIGLLKQKKQNINTQMQQVQSLAHQLDILEQQLSTVQKEWQYTQDVLPNLPMDDIKQSLGKDNVLLRQHLEKPQFDFPFKNHLELNEHLHLFDFKRAAKIAGTGWPAYCGMGARLEWALLNYMIDIHIKNGFTLWLPPLLARQEMLYSAGQLPKFENQQFKLQGDDFNLYLIPTAEMVLNGLHYDEIIAAEQLPLQYVSYTPCFRREAGAAGANERGLIRVHQFNKVEMFCFSHPAHSLALFEQMVTYAEEIVAGLQLHYRSMLLTIGDMSFAAMRTVDIEVWLPGQDRYYEVSSVSHCGDFQARRAQIRFREEGQKTELVHTLNGSGLATSRLMVALLENNQQADGCVIIPEVLRPYLGGITKLQNNKG